MIDCKGLQDCHVTNAVGNTKERRKTHKEINFLEIFFSSAIFTKTLDLCGDYLVREC